MLRLKFLRLEQNRSQTDVAGRTGIPRTQLSMMETGRLNPRPEELTRLGRLLGCSPERLLDHVVVSADDAGVPS